MPNRQQFGAARIERATVLVPSRKEGTVRFAVCWALQRHHGKQSQLRSGQL